MNDENRPDAALLRAYSDQLIRAQATLADADWLAARDKFKEFLACLMECECNEAMPQTPSMQRGGVR